MRNRKVILNFTFLILIGISALAISLFQSLPTPTSRLSAEREIYLTIIHGVLGIFPEELLEVREYTHIDELTILGEGEFQGCTSEWCTQFIANRMPNLKQDTLIDFQKQNRQSFSIKDYLPPIIENSLMHPDDIQQITRHISFSRIGFNSSLTQALVIVEDCHGDGCSNGSGDIYSIGDFLLFRKYNGEWVVEYRFNAWITELAP